MLSWSVSSGIPRRGAMAWQRACVAAVAASAVWGAASGAPTGNGELKTPVVLVPGFTGSSLEMLLQDKKSQFGCKTSTDGKWEVIWLDDHSFSPDNAFCFLENMAVDMKNGKFVTTPGVTIRPRDFGGLEGLSYLDKEKKRPSVYVTVVNFFKSHGYVEGTNLFGAPYDWRFAADRQGAKDEYFVNVQTLVENAHRTTGIKVALVAHSLGPSVIHEFLTSRPQAWRDEHIAAFIAVTPLWSGDVISAYYAISGFDCPKTWGASCHGSQQGMIKFFLREAMSRIPSSFWTFPQRGEGLGDDTWGREEVIVETPSKKYTAYDMVEMMKDLGLDSGASMVKHVEESPAKSHFPAPGVDTYVFYGTGIKTPSKYTYSKDFAPTNLGESPPQPSSVHYDEKQNGDGACPLRTSLRSQIKWPEEQKRHNKKLEHKAVPGMAHTNTKMMLPDALKILDSYAQEHLHGLRNATLVAPE